MSFKQFLELGYAIGTVLLVFSNTSTAQAQTTKPKVAYGKKSDQLLAKELWKALLSNRMVVRKRINVHAFEGKRPHFAVQQIYKATIKVKGRQARAGVKAHHTKKGRDCSKRLQQTKQVSFRLYGHVRQQNWL